MIHSLTADEWARVRAYVRARTYFELNSLDVARTLATVAKTQPVPSQPTRPLANASASSPEVGKTGNGGMSDG